MKHESYNLKLKKKKTSYIFQVTGLILIPINANPMQVLFGAFQQTTISKNTHSHVSRTLKISVQLKKQISYKRNMCLANNTTVVLR